MEIRKYENFNLEEIINLYRSVGWTNYLERTGILEEAYGNCKRLTRLKLEKTSRVSGSAQGWLPPFKMDRSFSTEHGMMTR